MPRRRPHLEQLTRATVQAGQPTGNLAPPGRPLLRLLDVVDFLPLVVDKLIPVVLADLVARGKRVWKVNTAAAATCDRPVADGWLHFQRPDIGQIRSERGEGDAKAWRQTTRTTNQTMRDAAAFGAVRDSPTGAPSHVRLSVELPYDPCGDSDREGIRGNVLCHDRAGPHDRVVPDVNASGDDDLRTEPHVPADNHRRRDVALLTVWQVSRRDSMIAVTDRRPSLQSSNQARYGPTPWLRSCSGVQRSSVLRR